MSKYEHVVYAKGYIMDADGNEITEGPAYDQWIKAGKRLMRSMQETGKTKPDASGAYVFQKPTAIKPLVSAIRGISYGR